MMEWWNGGMVEWWNGGLVECRRAKRADLTWRRAGGGVGSVFFSLLLQIECKIAQKGPFGANICVVRLNSALSTSLPSG